jgi:hypothetical protein
MFGLHISREAKRPSKPDPETQGFDADKALIRIALFASFAGAVVTIFAVSSTDHWRQLGVGLITAGGCGVAGALLGFIFGVPFSRDGSGSSHADSEDKSKDPKSKAPAPRYRANTSLEQISEWLSKMLVGVGLVELKNISRQLYELASFIASGLGNNDVAKVFAYFGILLFSGCGFLFGFIWARIYLRRWFTKADEDIKKLGDKVSRIEADSAALTLATQQLLHSSEEGSLASPEELADVFKKASRSTKAEIFDRARQASETDRATPEHGIRNEAAINIFRALIADDPRGYYHRTRAELAHALNRRTPPDVDEAITAISAAIDARDKHGVSGWKSYELRRARFRIHQDKEFNAGKITTSSLKEAILSDLKVARKDEKWKGWMEGAHNKVAMEWLQRNDPSVL